MPKASEKLIQWWLGNVTMQTQNILILRTIVGFLYSRSSRPDSKASTAADLEACSLHRVPSFGVNKSDDNEQCLNWSWHVSLIYGNVEPFE